LFTSGEIDAVRLVGPSAPATKRLAPVSAFGLVRRFARQPRALAVQLVDQRLHAVVGLCDGREEKVLVSTMSAPAMKYCRWMSRIASGCVRISRSLLPRRSRPVLEALAAKRGFVELQLLDHRAHGAVEHENALARGGLQRGARLRACCRRHQAVSFTFVSACCGRSPSRWQIA
jgi:hypothetical protein